MKFGDKQLDSAYEGVIKPVIREFGYSPTHYPPTFPGPATFGHPLLAMPLPSPMNNLCLRHDKASVRQPLYQVRQQRGAGRVTTPHPGNQTRNPQRHG